MLTIYAPQLTNRIRYTFELFFNELLDIPFQLITNRDKFLSANHPKISYGNESLADELFFDAVNLLFEKGVKPQSISVENFEDTKIFFKLISRNDSCLPFDPFAAGFYMVSRYEEYLPHVRDRFNRFPAHESLAFRNGFLSIPIVNHYAEIVKKKILERYPNLIFPEKIFEFIPTYDIDSAYAYLNKGFIRNFGGLMRSEAFIKPCN